MRDNGSWRWGVLQCAEVAGAPGHAAITLRDAQRKEGGGPTGWVALARGPGRGTRPVRSVNAISEHAAQPTAALADGVAITKEARDIRLGMADRAQGATGA